MPHDPKILLTQLLFYGSHLVWIYVAWTLWRWRRAKSRGQTRRRSDTLIAVRLGLAALFIWMRFVEPQWIITRETETDLGTGTRVALISDLHLGVFKGSAYIERLAERINAQQPDCVLIAGDLLYAPDVPLDELFSTLKTIRAPIYAVLGNHDDRELGWRRGGETESDEVIRGLTRAGVTVIEKKVVPCGKVMVAGIGDRWSNREDFRAAQAYQGSAPLVLLSHNPDTAYVVPTGLSRLLLSGHTHGGQIRLPFVYPYVLPVKGPFDRGLLQAAQWSEEPAGKPAVFTTSGVGEIGLPMRLLNPPAVDMLRL